MQPGVRRCFIPLDRIDQLTMRNLDIINTRDKLDIYTQLGLLTADTGAGIAQLGSIKSE